MKLFDKRITVFGLVLIGLVSLAAWQFSANGFAQDLTGGKDELQAQSNEVKRQARVERQVGSLLTKAREMGRVRVIVHPSFDFKMVRGQVDEDATKLRHNRVAAARNTLLSRVQSFARSEVKTYRQAPFVVLEADEYTLEMLKSLPEIEAIEEDTAYSPDLADSTSLIGATNAWNKGYSGAGQVIVIADTGVDKNHPFLQNKVVKEACFSTNSADSQSVCPNGQGQQEGIGAAAPPSSVMSTYYHGTHVAGIAAGKNANIGGLSFSGVAKDAKIIAIQVFSRVDDPAICKKFPAPCLKTNNSDLQAAVIYVLDQLDEFEIAALNMSLGGGSFSANCDGDNPGLAFYINKLKEQGVATVIGSGNDGSKTGISFPACISNAVSVGSTSKADMVATFSNSAAILDLLAPGVDVYSSLPGGGYGYLSGTSMAAPHVAGAFAVLKSKAPGASVDTLLNLLKNNGKLITDTNQVTKRRINVGAAIDGICPLTLSSGSLNVDGFGGAFQFNVTIGSICNDWKPTTSSSWIQIISPTAFVNGNGVVKFKVKPYFVSPYDPPKTRTGTIYVGGKQFKITQVSES